MNNTNEHLYKLGDDKQKSLYKLNSGIDFPILWLFVQKHFPYTFSTVFHCHCSCVITVSIKSE